MTTRTCWRCQSSFTGTGVQAFAPKPPGPMSFPKPLAGVILCLNCGSNGNNVLTPREMSRLDHPSNGSDRPPEDPPDVPDEQPALPYPDAVTGQSSGWSGSDTSAARAHRDDTSGRTSKRQRLVMALLSDAGFKGLTYTELGGITGMHHGQSSGVLSNLHHKGRIARLAQKRHGCKVYVMPEWADGREAEGPGRNPRRTDGDLAAFRADVMAVRDRLADLLDATPDGEEQADYRDLLEDLNEALGDAPVA
jgi:hypothetical protein